MTNDNPRLDMNGDELTADEVQMYATATAMTRAVLAQCGGQPGAILQAIAFKLLEEFMEVDIPHNLLLVVPVLRRMADEMEARAQAH